MHFSGDKKGQAEARFDLYALIELTGFEPDKTMKLNKIVITQVVIYILKKQKPALRAGFIKFSLVLAYQDSNLDKLNQNQLYYHYTIGQSANGLQK